MPRLMMEGHQVREPTLVLLLSLAELPRREGFCTLGLEARPTDLPKNKSVALPLYLSGSGGKRFIDRTPPVYGIHPGSTDT